MYCKICPLKSVNCIFFASRIRYFFTLKFRSRTEKQEPFRTPAVSLRYTMINGSESNGILKPDIVRPEYLIWHS